MLIELSEVGLKFGDREIFWDVTASVSRGDRIGLVGANGTGKSTLLSCIAGMLAPDEGRIHIARDVKVGYLKQNAGLDGSGTVLAEMEGVFERTLEIRRKMETLEGMMSVLAGAGYEAAAAQYADLRDEYEAAEGFSVPVKIRTVLTGMGFAGRENAVISTLSGGEKTRLALAKLLLEAPDVLLLDEPTNHLDFRTLLWLESYLEEYGGAILTVSHDRYFLDKRCTRIWELEDTKVSLYRGNYSAYKVQKAERLKTALKEYEKETARAVSLQDYVQKNIVRASTSNMAKSRRKQLERIQLPQKPREHTPAPRFSFTPAYKPVKDVLEIADLDLTVGIPPKTLVPKLDLSVLRGERVAVIGDNGTGKTTLMRRLFSAKSGADTAVNWGRGVSLSFFEQENDSLVKENTVMAELWRHVPGADPQRVRDRLGAMLFSGEDVFTPVSVLSGGEKARLAFAVLAEEHANVLLLDEPTNHLDLPAREALEKAAAEFEGTVIFVSHDRYFINTLATKVLELRPDGARLYAGNFDAYLNETAKEETPKPPPKQETEGAAVYHRSKQQRAEEAKRRKRIAQLEELIARCEREIGEANTALSADAGTDFEEAQRLCALIEETQSRCDGYMEEWAELSAQDDQEKR